MYVVSLLSRYMHCASEIHFQTLKRILRYVKGTLDYGIRFGQVKSYFLLLFLPSISIRTVNLTTVELVVAVMKGDDCSH